jgi:hypothetical protein
MTALFDSRCQEELRVVKPFRYDPLLWLEEGSTNYSFRVLRLLPGSLGDPIFRRLEVHHTDSPPQYEAISYCWVIP